MNSTSTTSISLAGPIEKLTISNYRKWSRDIKNHLIIHKLWSYVDGSKPQPTTNDEEKAAWSIEDKRVIALISQSVSEYLQDYVSKCTSSKDAWDTLRKECSDQDILTKVQTQEDFYQVKRLPGESISDMVSRINHLANLLAELGSTIPDNEIALRYIRALPKEAQGRIMNTIIGQVDKITTETARFLLRENEPFLAPNDASALLVQKQSANKKKGKSRQRCNFCKKYGHTEQDCRNKNGKNNNDHGSVNYAFLFRASTTTGHRDKWILDSGASHHFCCRRDWFHEYADLPKARSIFLGDGSPKNAIGSGTVKFLPEGFSKPIVVTNVLYVPDLTGNLMSVGRASEKAKVIFDRNPDCAVTTRSGTLLFTARKEGALYVMNVTPDVPSATAYITASDVNQSAILWHRRLGHFGFDSLCNSTMSNAVSGVPKLTLPADHERFCVVCADSKLHRASINKSTSTISSTQRLELIHSDLCGPFSTSSHGGAYYFATFTDDVSRMVWISFLKKKSDLLQHFQAFKAFAEKQAGSPIKSIRSDNGGEYASQSFQAFLQQHGIEWQPSAPRTPEHNGVAERMNRTLVEAARSMLQDSSLPLQFWAEAIQTAAYIRNRRPMRVLKNTTPYEAWYGKKPSLAHLRVFGCTAHVLASKIGRDKFDAKSTRCILIGYAADAYKLYNPVTKRVLCSRDVVFNEQGEEKPATTKQAGPQLVTLIVPSDVETRISDDHDTFKSCKINPDLAAATSIPPSPKLAPRSDSENFSSDDNSDDDRSIATHKPRRNIKPPARLIEETSAEYLKHHANVAYCDESMYCYAVSLANDPLTVKEALSSDNAQAWKKAMQSEYDSLTAANTWDLVDLPPGRSIVSCKWVFRTKYDAQGNVEKYKARLVARGFTQRHGIDYEETFSPVVRLTSIRTLLSVATQLGYEIHQADVSNAYISAELAEEVYMAQPEGYSAGNKVCRLRRSLYGLKQSGRAWYQKLDSTLLKHGFQRTTADPSLYRRGNGANASYIAIYVDDIIYACPNSTVMQEIKDTLHEEFNMKDLGKIHYILGMQIDYDKEKGTLFLHQSKYALSILERYGMANARPAGAPMDKSVHLRKPAEPPTIDEMQEMRHIPYLSAIGSLMYLSQATRPDLAYAIGALSRFNSDPRPVHWKAVKRVMQYLVTTHDLGLLYRRQPGTVSLAGYCDADFAGDLDNRRSTSGYAYLSGGATISWASKLQATVALSTAEAEYVATSFAAREAIWLRKLFTELHLPDPSPVELRTDNQSSMAIAKNPVHHQRTKHIDVAHHFIRGALEDGTIALSYCPSAEMAADVLTKPLPKTTHHHCLELLGICRLSKKSS